MYIYIYVYTGVCSALQLVYTCVYARVYTYIYIYIYTHVCVARHIGYAPPCSSSPDPAPVPRRPAERQETYEPDAARGPQQTPIL